MGNNDLCLSRLFTDCDAVPYDAFPKSVVLHFPPNVYQNTGATQMLPLLLQILKPDELRCVQFLRGGKVRVSFKDRAVRDHHLSEGIRFAGHDIPVTRHAEKVTTVYLRDLPYEVAGDDVFDFFGAYGEVLTVELFLRIFLPCAPVTGSSR